MRILCMNICLVTRIHMCLNIWKSQGLVGVLLIKTVFDLGHNQQYLRIEIKGIPLHMEGEKHNLNKQLFQTKAWFMREHKHKDRTEGKTKEWSQACDIRIVVIISKMSYSKHKLRAEQEMKQRKILFVLSLEVPEEIYFVFSLILSLCLRHSCEPGLI